MQLSFVNVAAIWWLEDRKSKRLSEMGARLSTHIGEAGERLSTQIGETGTRLSTQIGELSALMARNADSIERIEAILVARQKRKGWLW